MARTLPENTVDAWTAISLAAQGAEWIWLPTRNQGATSGGTHPGDVSALVGRRLVLIESKGIEDTTRIAFGSDGRAQRAHLRAVEEAGLDALRRWSGASLPILGWVVYGLPLLPGPVSGNSWREFPLRHHLVCPHDLDAARVGTVSSTIKKLGTCALSDRTTDHRCDPLVQDRRPVQPLVLGALRWAVDRGLVGLPLIGNDAGSRVIQSTLSDLEPASDEVLVARDQDGDSLLDLLARLADVAQHGSSHVSLVVL